MPDADIVAEFGQLFIMAFDGPWPAPDTLEYLRTFRIGGLILFEDNYESPEQLRELIAVLQARGGDDHAPLFVCADHEGGRVQRFRRGFTPLPSMAEAGRGTPAATEHLFRTAGRELRGVAVNLNLGPVADVCAADQPGTIGDRSFGTDPATVARHVAAAIRGLAEEGVLACVKHFPGQGGTGQDGHREVPCVPATLERLQQHDLIPFRAAIAAGAAAVMTAHVTYPDCVSGDTPASLSTYWVTDVLRRQLGFAGLVVSDALEMKGIMTRYDPIDSGRLALAAGTDLLLYYKEDDQYEAFYALRQALRHGDIDPAPIAASIRRIRQVKQRWITAAGSRRVD